MDIEAETGDESTKSVFGDVIDVYTRAEAIDDGVLVDDTVFPATKRELIKKQGWKVFDFTENEHVHAGVLLGKLPDRKYGVWRK